MLEPVTEDAVTAHIMQDLAVIDSSAPVAAKFAALALQDEVRRSIRLLELLGYVVAKEAPEICGARYGLGSHDGSGYDGGTAVCRREAGHPSIAEDGTGHTYA